MPRLIKNVKELRTTLHSIRCDSNTKKSIGFVPTMGYLHRGHRELIKLSKIQNDVTILSIYVNPLQFGEGEDYERYPRDLARDLGICEEEGVDIVFAPEDEEMYPQKPSTVIDVPGLTDILEGAFRPGHFRGVSIVVTKLFNIVQPDRAYFGEKDYQQLKLIQRLVTDLSFPIEIVPVETVRETDGLAYSSRNTYLSAQERENALCIYKSFLLAQKLFSKGNTDPKLIKEAVIDFISKHPLVKKIDYVEIKDQELRDVERVKEGDRLLVALWVGDTRLIDNWRFKNEPL